MRSFLDWLMTWQFVIGFFSGAGIVWACWIATIFKARREAEHRMDEAPVQNCCCRMCEAARAAKM